MKCVDPGHRYIVDGYDDGSSQELTFMKREGRGYPFNVGVYGGTNAQEVIRALIDRVLYLDAQVPAPENDLILSGLRSALLAFELRAARRHVLTFPSFRTPIEQLPTCPECGHIVCPHRQMVDAEVLE